MKTRTIDLELDESERWAGVIGADGTSARRVARESLSDLPAIVRALGGVFRATYAWSGGRYVGEIDAWAEALGLGRGEATLLQCSYELSHSSGFLSGLPGRIFGCTAAVGWVPSLGMVHVRSLDWPLRGIGPATRLFRFRRGPRAFVSVGIAGFVGVLSGMLPGAYSVTINWAPPVERPGFGFGPAFLLREVLEECDSYEEAVHVLRTTPLASSVFFVVCGTRRGQACVIERTRDDASVRRAARPWLVQANHHVARRFAARNAAFDRLGMDVEESVERQRALEERLATGPTRTTLARVATSLEVDPVFNGDTHQHMAFCPRSGQVRVWSM